MKRPAPYFALAAAILFSLCAGCVPARFTTVPEIKGRAVDRSGTPIPLATIRLERIVGERCETIEPELICDADGRFSRKEESRWGVYIVPMDCFSSRFAATASSQDARSESKIYSEPYYIIHLLGIGRTDVADFGDLIVKD